MPRTITVRAYCLKLEDLDATVDKAFNTLETIESVIDGGFEYSQQWGAVTVTPERNGVRLSAVCSLLPEVDAKSLCTRFGCEFTTYRALEIHEARLLLRTVGAPAAPSSLERFRQCLTALRGVRPRPLAVVRPDGVLHEAWSAASTVRLPSGVLGADLVLRAHEFGEDQVATEAACYQEPFASLYSLPRAKQEEDALLWETLLEDVDPDTEGFVAMRSRNLAGCPFVPSCSLSHEGGAGAMLLARIEHRLRNLVTPLGDYYALSSTRLPDVVKQMVRPRGVLWPRHRGVVVVVPEGQVGRPRYPDEVEVSAAGPPLDRDEDDGTPGPFFEVDETTGRSFVFVNAFNHFEIVTCARSQYHAQLELDRVTDLVNLQVERSAEEFAFTEEIGWLTADPKCAGPAFSVRPSYLGMMDELGLTLDLRDSEEEAEDAAETTGGVAGDAAAPKMA